jgi:hypothetical protein
MASRAQVSVYATAVYDVASVLLAFIVTNVVYHCSLLAVP